MRLVGEDDEGAQGVGAVDVGWVAGGAGDLVVCVDTMAGDSDAHRVILPAAVCDGGEDRVVAGTSAQVSGHGDLDLCSVGDGFSSRSFAPDIRNPGCRSRTARRSRR
jgi:hypothetical protein